MQINLVSSLFVLESEKNSNIRKNDIKKIKVLTINDSLPSIIYDGTDLKEQVKKYLSSIIGSNIFHLEQVYAISYNESIDIIFLAVTNINNVKKLKKDFKFVDFNIKNNDTIIFDSNEYKYKTIEKEENNNIEYIHDIKCKEEEKRTLMNLLISYKRIRSNIDNTDILFKFMDNSFTLEDVRIVYELIKDCSVDKSNFRKKIVKYCEKIDEINSSKTGFRPSSKYRFKPLKGDIWL